MKTRSWLRTKLFQTSSKRSGCLLLSKQTKHKQNKTHKVNTPKVPSWPPVYFFLLNCPVTCCLDTFFHLHKFFHLLPLFYIIGPTCHCDRSRLSPSSTFPTPFSLHPTGPACHCGMSRLSPSSTFPTPFSLPPTGPACHCGRSRLFPSSSFSTPPSSSLSYRPGLSLWQVPPISFYLLYISSSSHSLL